nr:MAG TPA: hypothetical protein [Caudoviricetes sp.]
MLNCCVEICRRLLLFFVNFCVDTVYIFIYNKHKLFYSFKLGA